MPSLRMLFLTIALQISCQEEDLPQCSESSEYQTCTDTFYPVYKQCMSACPTAPCPGSCELLCLASNAKAEIHCLQLTQCSHDAPYLSVEDSTELSFCHAECYDSVALSCWTDEDLDFGDAWGQISECQAIQCRD